MPSSFAEVWLRIYTKDEAFHGLVQAAYRHILSNLVSLASSPSLPGSPPAAAVDEDMEQDGFDADVLLGNQATEEAEVMIQVVGEGEGAGAGAGAGAAMKVDEKEGDGSDLDIEPAKTWRPNAPTSRGGIGLGPPPLPPSRAGRRTFSRNVSTASVGSVGSVEGRTSRSVGRGTGRTPSFTENKFTAVAPNFRGESPSRKPSKRGRERGRDVSAGGGDVGSGGSGMEENERPKKSPRMSSVGKGGGAS